MIISRVRIKNFRGFVDKTIDFKSKTVVLLYASNGLGKTTVVDAIEWCLTGDIGRLKTAYLQRSTNETDRKKNTKGIIKNRDADQAEDIEISLWILVGGEEKILRRVQKVDALDKTQSKLTLNGSEKEAEDFVKKYIGDSFYNYHFCDVQKSFNIQSAKRDKLGDLFSDFITNYDEQKRVAANLELFADDVSRYIEDLEGKGELVKQKIGNYESQLARAREKAMQIAYPTVSFFEGEKTNIDKLNKEALISQRKTIEGIGYRVAENCLGLLCKNEEIKGKISILDCIRSFRSEYAEELGEAKRQGLIKDRNIVATFEEELMEVKSIPFDKESIVREYETRDLFKRDEKGFNLFVERKKQLVGKEEELGELNDEIKLLSNNNKILGLMSTLATSKEILVEYRENSKSDGGAAKCPICGSETFATLDVAHILEEADNYIEQNGELVKKKQVEKNRVATEIEQIYQKLIRTAKDRVTNEITKLESKIDELRRLQVILKPYFELLDSLKKMEPELIFDELDDTTLEGMYKLVQSIVLTDSKEKDEKESYERILTVLGYSFENETLQQTYSKLKGIDKCDCAYTNYSYEDFIGKINAIDNILADKEIQGIEKEKEKSTTEYQEIDTKITNLRKLENKARNRAIGIENLVSELLKDEYQKVGPALTKYYNKLIRIDNNVGIKIIHEDGGLSLVDRKGKNIVNVLSNGQISVFMLAFFFAGINARNEHEEMKVFFIDDLTACMDDVNMLAFLDLLKYQMDAKENMDQLFFATCDERISELLKYKMAGREVELQEIKEIDLAV